MASIGLFPSLAGLPLVTNAVTDTFASSFEPSGSHPPSFFDDGPQPDVLLSTCIRKGGQSQGGGNSIDFKQEAIRLRLIPAERVNQSDLFQSGLFTQDEYVDEESMHIAITALVEKIEAFDKKRKGTNSKIRHRLMRLLCYIIGETHIPQFKPFLELVQCSSDRALAKLAEEALKEIQRMNLPESYMERRLVKRLSLLGKSA